MQRWRGTEALIDSSSSISKQRPIKENMSINFQWKFGYTWQFPNKCWKVLQRNCFKNTIKRVLAVSECHWYHSSAWLPSINLANEIIFLPSPPRFMSSGFCFFSLCFQSERVGMWNPAITSQVSDTIGYWFFCKQPKGILVHKTRLFQSMLLLSHECLFTVKCVFAVGVLLKSC